jgi:FKBP-type peptidyl-prolyl cis-trans isomerase FkpA
MEPTMRRTLLGAAVLATSLLGFTACQGDRSKPDPSAFTRAPLSTRKLPTGSPGEEITFEEIQAGAGEKPTATSKVKVHYRGTLADGKEFDSSYKGEPIEFPLNAVIKCWTLGLQEMKVGGKARLTCPPGVAYGDREMGKGVIPANSTLIFEIDLLDVRM